MPDTVHSSMANGSRTSSDKALMLMPKLNPNAGNTEERAMV